MGRSEHALIISRCGNMNFMMLFYWSVIPPDCHVSLRHFPCSCFLTVDPLVSKQSVFFFFNTKLCDPAGSPLESKGIPERRSASALPSHHPRSLSASQLFATFSYSFQIFLIYIYIFLVSIYAIVQDKSKALHSVSGKRLFVEWHVRQADPPL